MKKTSIKKLSQNIFEDVIKMQSQFTSDNSLSKFFPPESINEACYIISGALASTLYPDTMPFEEVKGSALHMLYYLGILLGFNTYLKELSYNTTSAPFSFIDDEPRIEAIREDLFQKATRGELDATLLGEAIITRFYTHLLKSRTAEDFTIKEFKITDINFEKYLGAILYWGYNFASEVVISEKKK